MADVLSDHEFHRIVNRLFSAMDTARYDDAHRLCASHRELARRLAAAEAELVAERDSWADIHAANNANEAAVIVQLLNGLLARMFPAAGPQPTEAK